MDRFEIIKRKKELAIEPVYKQIREELCTFIIKQSASGINAEAIRGMLLLLNEVDKWEEQYEAYIEKKKREKQ